MKKSIIILLSSLIVIITFISIKYARAGDFGIKITYPGRNGDVYNTLKFVPAGFTWGFENPPTTITGLYFGFDQCWHECGTDTHFDLYYEYSGYDWNLTLPFYFVLPQNIMNSGGCPLRFIVTDSCGNKDDICFYWRR